MVVPPVVIVVAFAITIGPIVRIQSRLRLRRFRGFFLRRGRHIHKYLLNCVFLCDDFMLDKMPEFFRENKTA